jgi:plasmid maintenance system antidote protein VapI
MLRAGITAQQIADLLGVHLNTIYAKLGGKSDFTVKEAIAIRDKLLPELSVEAFGEVEADAGNG